MARGVKIAAVKTEDCPCKGQHARLWHRTRGLLECEHSQNLRAHQKQEWKIRNRIAQGLVPNWVPGTSIYLDEEEAMA